MQQEKEFGLWPSPISAELVSSGSKKFGTIEIHNDKIFWEEVRPLEGGKTALTSNYGDITPPDYNVRSMVHEYGGKSFTVHGSTVFFVNKADQRIYEQQHNKLFPITEEGVRYADLCMSSEGLIAVGEFHFGGPLDIENFLAIIDRESKQSTRLAEGCDFYSSPTFHAPSSKLAYISWNLPNLPWDGSELWVSHLKDKKLHNPKKIAGSKTESITQPKWGPEGHLYFISDRSGFWNLYRLHGDQIEPLCPMEAEFAHPQWTFGMSTYDFIGDKILCTYFANGVASLATIDLVTKEMKKLPLDASSYNQIRANQNKAVYIKGTPLSSPSIVQLDLSTMQETILEKPQMPPINAEYLSEASPLSFPSKNGRTAYGFFYPPKNPLFKGPKGDLPPLIVKVHGGPTSHVTATFSLAMQYWTSRGFAVLLLNYGGSAGYGRGYRDLLNGNWGVVDVEDSEAGAEYLVNKGLVDPKKLVIAGGSAGGYTTLMALTFTHLFRAGTSYYGVSDLELLTKSHKFESQYTYQLIGPLPECQKLYKERSPLSHVDKLNKPVLFLQGSEDAIVPPEQALLLFEALKKKHLYTRLVIYRGEGHGFRKGTNIVHSLQEELLFYLRIFYEENLSHLPIEKIVAE